jgi:trk system potassium uptake protein TrkA
MVAVHIVVMGCGRVGSSLAQSLAKLGHSVAVVDQDPQAFKRLGEHFPGRTIKGMGFDRETLLDAGIETADAFAAVSSGDNSNIIAARVARETFGVARVVARIYDPKRAEVYERLGIPTVATVPWTSNRLMRSVLGDATSEDWRDPSGQVALIQVSPHEGWIGSSLPDFESASGGRVGFLTRFGTGLLPVAGTLIQSGDVLHVLTTDALVGVLKEVAAAAPHGAQS